MANYVYVIDVIINLSREDCGEPSVFAVVREGEDVVYATPWYEADDAAIKDAEGWCRATGISAKLAEGG